MSLNINGDDSLEEGEIRESLSEIDKEKALKQIVSISFIYIFAWSLYSKRT